METFLLPFNCFVNLKHHYGCLVPKAGFEPARPLGARDFKSLMSTNFITSANKFKK